MGGGVGGKEQHVNIVFVTIITSLTVRRYLPSAICVAVQSSYTARVLNDDWSDLLTAKNCRQFITRSRRIPLLLLLLLCDSGRKTIQIELFFCDCITNTVFMPFLPLHFVRTIVVIRCVT